MHSHGSRARNPARCWSCRRPRSTRSCRPGRWSSCRPHRPSWNSRWCRRWCRRWSASPSRNRRRSSIPRWSCPRLRRDHRSLRIPVESPTTRVGRTFASESWRAASHDPSRFDQSSARLAVRARVCEALARSGVRPHRGGVGRCSTSVEVNVGEGRPVWRVAAPVRPPPATASGGRLCVCNEKQPGPPRVAASSLRRIGAGVRDDFAGGLPGRDAGLHSGPRPRLRSAAGAAPRPRAEAVWAILFSVAAWDPWQGFSRAG